MNFQESSGFGGTRLSNLPGFRQYAAHPSPAPLPNLGVNTAWTPHRSWASVSTPGNKGAQASSPFHHFGAAPPSDTQLREALDKAHEENNALRAQVYQAETKLLENRRVIDELSVPAAGWRTTLEEKDSEIKDLQTKVQQADFIRGKVTQDLKLLKESHAKEIDSLRSKLEAAKNEVQDIRSESSTRSRPIEEALQQANIKGREMTNEIIALKSMQNQLENTIAQLRSEVNAAGGDAVKGREFETAFWELVSIVQSEPGVSKGPPSPSRGPHARVLDDAKSIVNGFMDQQLQVAELTGALSAAENRISTLEGNVSDARESYKSIEAAREADREHFNEELRNQHVLFTCQIAAVQNELEAVRRQPQEAESFSSTQDRSSASFPAANNGQIQELQSELSEKRQEILAQNSIVGSLKQKLDDALRRNEQLAVQFATAEAQAVAQQTSICTLQARLMEERHGAVLLPHHAPHPHAEGHLLHSHHSEISGPTQAAVRDVNESEVTSLMKQISRQRAAIRAISAGREIHPTNETEEVELSDVLELQVNLAQYRRRVAALEHAAAQHIASRDAVIDSLRTVVASSAASRHIQRKRSRSER